MNCFYPQEKKTGKRMKDLRIKKVTHARVNLKRSGHAIATQEILKIKYAHIKAQQAIHQYWEVNNLQSNLEHAQHEVLVLSSGIDERTVYLQRPDLGRVLSNESIEYLKTYQHSHL